MEARFTGQRAATMNPAYYEGEALFFSIEVTRCPVLHARDVLCWLLQHCLCVYSPSSQRPRGGALARH